MHDSHDMASQFGVSQAGLVTQGDGNTTLTYPEYGATVDARSYLGLGMLTQESQVDPWTERQDAQQPGAARAEGRGSVTQQLSQLDFNGFDDTFEAGAEQQAAPEHACSYCGVANPACVVKCLATGKWFCNGRIAKAGSCAIVHLVKSKNKEVQLHKDSPLGDAVLECYATGTRNLFVLGFVPVKSENTVVLLARDTPANHAAIKDLSLDLTQWQPIVEERALVSWLVKLPTDRDRRLAPPITLDAAMKLEEVWKTRPAAKLDDIDTLPAGDAAGEEEEVTPVALKYTDVHQYHSVFRPLVKLEADYDKAMKEAQSRDNISVRWEWGLNHKRCAHFFFPKDDTDVRLLPGDELKLRHINASNKGPWEGSGIVLRCDQSEEVCLEMSKNDVPDDCTVGFHVDFVWKATSFDRMRSALSVLDKDRTSISAFLYHTLLGHNPEPITLRIHPSRKGLEVPNLPALNHSQLAAVKAVLASPISLVQGPPGTGKTVTSAAVMYHIVQSCKRPDEPCLLVAAPSNVAVDQLAQKANQTGLKVVRLCAKSREDVSSPCEHLTLHYQVRHVELPGADMYRKLLQLREDQGGLRVEDEKQLFNLRRKLEIKILEAADVICCTCVGAGDPRLKGFRFQHVLIDEATQAAEPECLIPMVMGAKQIILVGDHCQLGPVIMCKRAAEAGLSQSLFERLRLLGVKPIRLQVQYRMHPCLSEFPSNTFYEGSLQNGTGVGDRILRGVDFPWPIPGKPMMFYCQLGSEEISGSGTSFLNRTEASNVEKIVTRFLQNGVTPAQIGVITPYEGQRAHIVSVLSRLGTLRQDLYTDIEVSSVDAFQGREKDIIILSCVRSNEQQSVGFLGDPRRLNVALTRARYGLVILGNPRVLSRQPLWSSLLQHFKEAGCLVEGPLNNLKPSMVQIAPSRKAFDRAQFGVGVLTTNRYQPPENVGDPMPSATVEPPPAPGEPASTKRSAGLPPPPPLPGAAGLKDVKSKHKPSTDVRPSGLSQVLMPFMMPSYTIADPSASQDVAGRLLTQVDMSMRTQATQPHSDGMTFRTQYDQPASQATASLSQFPGVPVSMFDVQQAEGLDDEAPYDALLLSQMDVGSFVDPSTGQAI